MSIGRGEGGGARGEGPPPVGEPRASIEVPHQVDLGLDAQDRGQKAAAVWMQTEASIGKGVQAVDETQRRRNGSQVGKLLFSAARDIDSAQHEMTVRGAGDAVQR